MLDYEEKRKQLMAQIEKAVEDYLRQQERFCIYRSWWQDMLGEYKARCSGMGSPFRYPLYPESLTLASLQKSSPDSGFSGSKGNRR